MIRKKILVVDDNEVILKTLSFALKGNGYDVFTAVDGAGALATVRRQSPDVMLLDLGFPPEVSGVPWDGFRIVQWLQGYTEAKDIPFIVITGGSAEKYKARALQLGASDFFEKPVKHQELFVALRRILEDKPATAPQAH
jgi:CheY-like chemotaxis protein